MAIRAVLFDMDGVLIDAKDWHFHALNDALAVFGLAISRDEHVAVYDGLPTRRKLEILSATRGLPVKLHGFLNDIKQRRTLELTYQQCRPIYPHQYALARLKREGFGLAVCSNSIRQTVAAMMQQASLIDFLEFYLSNQDVSQPKPSPEIYTMAINRFGLEPDECLIVEDNEHGIQAARASGGHVMIVTSVYDVTYSRIRAEITKAEAK
jgi:HAD superfamily hydrolase (TIGR01509 family)